MSILDEVLAAVGLRLERTPSADAIIIGTLLSSAVIILGVEVLKKP